MKDCLLTELSAVPLSDAHGSETLADAAIAIRAGRIAWVGPRQDCPAEYADLPHKALEGRLVTPALIDCHTHIVYGGQRAREFALRLQGASYADIARAGGGIAGTVAATRAASEAELQRLALSRLDALIREGVSTVEIKSGYGLDIDTELKMLRVARELARLRPVRVRTTFLGAHAVPAGMNAERYLDDVCLPALTQAAEQGLVDAVDGFCEGIAFSAAQLERVFQRAQQLGLPVKLHAEQLSHQSGCALAARYGALSADHVEYANETDAAALAAAGSVAVLLPGAFYTLNETQRPPVEAFRRHQVPMAVATDWNPGSSPLGSLLLAMNMACTLFRLTPLEALAGTTRHAARALGLSDCGQIAVGMRADLAVWNVEDPQELAYGIAINPLHKRYFADLP